MFIAFNDFTIASNCSTISLLEGKSCKLSPRAGHDLGGGPTNFGRPKVQKAQVPLCFTIQSRDFDQMHHSKMTPPRREREKT